MESKARSKKSIGPTRARRELPIIQESCSFAGYDAELLMNETSRLRGLITKRGTLERNGILVRKAYNEIPPRVEYRLTDKGQELVESVIDLLLWMRKWS
jgi:hypothetical protein